MTEFIAITSNDIGGNSPYQTKKIFEKEFNVNDYSEWKNIYNYSLRKQDNKLVYISSDKNVGIPIISGLNERFMIQENDRFSSNLKILYFSNYHELDDLDQNKLTNSLLSQLLGWTKCIFEEHKLSIKPEQIILIGLNDEDYDLDLEEINNMNIEYYTLSMIKKKGFETILNKIVETNKENKILSYFNLEVFNKKICPSVIRRNLAIEDEISLDSNNNNKMINGIEYDSLEGISNILKNKVDYLIITGFNTSVDNKTNFWSRLTSEVVQILYRNIMDIKEKKINLFNENSRFLIFRELKQKSEDDLGWYILRLMSMEDRLKILEHVQDDKIYVINLNDFGLEKFEEKEILDTDSDEIIENEILISATTIDDQNKKTYYHCKSIMDCTLFPQEKFLMGFELVNF